jgi:hypothetical protein
MGKSKYIDRTGYHVKKSKITKEKLSEIKAKLTVRPKTMDFNVKHLAAKRQKLIRMNCS